MVIIIIFYINSCSGLVDKVIIHIIKYKCNLHGKTVRVSILKYRISETLDCFIFQLMQFNTAVGIR